MGFDIGGQGFIMSTAQNNQGSDSSTPPWTNTTKLIVGLSLVGVMALLIVQLRTWIAPLMLAFIIAYILYPLAAWINEAIRMPWSLSVGLIYLILVLIILGLLTWGGITFVQPIQNLVKFIQKTLNQLPTYLEQASQLSLSFGPLQIDASKLDLNTLADQLVNIIRPLVSQAGFLFGSFATGAAAIVGRIFFLLLVSYFVLSETKGEVNKVIDVRIPGYQEDLNKLGKELSRIWNAFLRGQLILIGVAILAYTILLSILGLRFVLALALLAGIARFVPYIGPWITWITYFLVALLQGTTLYGLEPWVYAIIIVGLALLTDTIIDNLLAPRVYANALRVHPAAVLVAILVSAAWLGLIGIVLAAPVLATIKLFWNYVMQKMFDRDPWEIIQAEPIQTATLPKLSDIKIFVYKAWNWMKMMFKRLQNRLKHRKKEEIDK
jgi:predicted PurR-regulated permease PerM